MQQEINFKLIGHDNPLESYPAPVVPIGYIGSKLVAVYVDIPDEQPCFESIAEDSIFIRHNEILEKSLSEFDLQKHRLFGLSSDNVVLYLITEEKIFFLNFLKDENFSQINPFLRLSLAKETRDIFTISKEIVTCVRYLENNSPSLISNWYRNQKSDLSAFWKEKSGQDFPENWEKMLSVTSPQNQTIERRTTRPIIEDIIFKPLRFRNLTVKNRIFCSSISGQWDNYDGSGTQARINWEEKFARGGVGAIITSFVPVAIRGRIMPNYATIHCDERIPFWRKVGEKVHEYDCKLILQLSHSGRQQHIPGIENKGLKALSSTSNTESLHGFLCQAMTLAEIKETIQMFADGARRARLAGLDGIELHSANGYLFNQFLSSGINDRQDEYGGSLENRARFLLDVIRAIRKEVGNDFHLQFKISAIDYNDAVIPWEKPGNTLEESIQICKWAEEAGADAVHVSVGSLFPHPLNPIGDFNFDVIKQTYDAMFSSAIYTSRNYRLFHYRWLHPIVEFLWNRVKKQLPPPAFSGDYVPDDEMKQLLADNQGRNLLLSRAIKQALNIPVLCTGGFQQASFIRKAIKDEYCDGVTIARPLIANNDLVKQFQQGKDLPDKPCTYCNKCLLNVIKNPLGCYELSRFDNDYEAMMAEIMSVYGEHESTLLRNEVVIPSLNI